MHYITLKVIMAQSTGLLNHCTRCAELLQHGNRNEISARTDKISVVSGKLTNLQTYYLRVKTVQKGAMKYSS